MKRASLPLQRILLRCMSLKMALFGSGPTDRRCPFTGQKRKSLLNNPRSVDDPARVETFFVSQKLHTTGRDEPRRDRLSLFLLYRVWNQEGRNLGATLTR